MQLKTEYKAETGTDYTAPGIVPVAAKQDTAPTGGDKKKNKTSTAEKVSATSTASSTATKASTPTLKPATSAPATTATTSNGASRNIPSVESLIENGTKVNVQKLNERLQVYSFVNGYAPTSADLKIFELLKKGNECEGPSVTQAGRWYRQMASYSVDERAAW